VVVGAAVVGDHVMRLPFIDGTVADVDFSSEQWPGVLEPPERPGSLRPGDCRPRRRDYRLAQWHQPRPRVAV